MSSNEFAMVEELAFLVKGDIYCKELVLSVEDAFVDFLQNNSSSKRVLELEPMNSYKRLLVHRLADIFGFSHHSVGEGDDRHIVVEQCPGTSIPSILVRDLLWKYGELNSPEDSDQESEDGSEVKDLAYTVKNNLPCKHLILSMEEAFIKFLQDDTSSNGVLELKPMDSYSRHLLHRLADIFGLSHHSEGEGEDRHLVVEQCSETLIPSVLVRDVLQQCGEVVSPLNFDVLSRKHEGADGSSQAENPETKHFTSLDEKEASYLAARQRIFSGDANEAGNATERPKKDLKVARRMIEHALGQKIRQSNNEIIFTALDEQRGREAMDGVIIKEEGGTEMKMDMNNNSVGSLLGEEKSEGGIGKEDLIKEQHMGGVIIKEEGGTEMKMDMNNNSVGSLLGEVKSEGRIWKEDLIKEQHMDGVIIKEEGGTEMKVDTNNNGVGSLLGEVKSEGGIWKDDLIKEQHMGAAKRLFANALGIPRDANLSKGSVESKQMKVFRVKKEEEDTLADCST